MTESDAVHEAPPLRTEALPEQPPSVDEATTLSALLGNELPRFAMTFDGYAFYGERWAEIMHARREEWERGGTLPRDVDALRALLFLAFRQERFLELDDATTIRDADDNVTHEAQPEHITEARREHERFKHAILARMRELVLVRA